MVGARVIRLAGPLTSRDFYACLVDHLNNGVTIRKDAFHQEDAIALVFHALGKALLETDFFRFSSLFSKGAQHRPLPLAWLFSHSLPSQGFPSLF